MQEIDLEALKVSIHGVVPEIGLGIVAATIVLCNLFKPLNRISFFVAIIGIVVYLLNIGFGEAFKVIMCMSALATIVISGRRQSMEFYLLIIFVLLGAVVLVMSTNFIMILLSIEMISISSYVLTAGTTPDRHRAEAAWKFFIYGSVATAVMVFGMTYLYGATGSLAFPHVDQTSLLFTVGGLMMLGGFLFKMTAAPFHLWAPTVYEATPAPIVAFLSVVPKLAGFVIVVKWITSLNSTVTIAAVAILSIVVGTLAALNQTDSKRMMAYSSVAQAGFLLIIPASSIHFSVAIFYATVFAIMNFVVFLVINEIEKSGKGTSFKNFSGIGNSNPLIAVCITLGLISLAGLPPTAGFMAKLFIFSGLWSKFHTSKDFIFLALFIVGLLATAASLYFYLRIPFYAFFRRSEENQPIKISLLTNLLLVILVGLLLALFLAPGLFDGLSY